MYKSRTFTIGHLYVIDGGDRSHTQALMATPKATPTATTVELVNTIGTHPFVLCSLSEVILYRVCILEYIWCVLCWEVYPLPECPLSEVSLYYESYYILLVLRM